MEPSTSSSCSGMSNEKCSDAVGGVVSVEVEQHVLYIDDDAGDSQEDEGDSEEDVFIPSSVCPKTPDLKSFNKLQDRFGKQCCSTPLTTPKLTPRLGKISEEDLSITISETTVEFSETMPKSETNVFQVVLAFAMFIFLFGFACGFYLSFPKKETGKQPELMMLTTTTNSILLDQSADHQLLTQSYTLDEVTKWAVGNVSVRRLDEAYRSSTNQLCVSSSPCNTALANQIAEKWKHFGISDVIQEPFQVTISVPESEKTSSIKMVHSDGTIVLYRHLYGRAPVRGANQGSAVSVTAPPEVEGSTNDDGLTGDAARDTRTTSHPTQRPNFVPFSNSGDVQGQLVYANFGRLDDFNTITKMRINTKGTIALIRNGLRTIRDKILNAKRFGVIGVILYDDPAEKGYLPRIPSSFDVTGVMGDPFTPYFPSNGVYRSTNDDTNLPNFPVHIVESNVAYELLNNLNGKVAPDDWQGGFSNITYHVGKKKNSDVLVELAIHNRQEEVMINNVIATIKGKLYPDEVVLIGSHRTSFPEDTQAAASSVAMATELASVIGQLVQDGWQPERTIMLCSWAGHEYGFSGSVEWMQKHRMGLLQNVVAYVDVDAHNGLASDVHVVSSPLLRRMLRESAGKLGIQLNVQNESLTLDGDHAPYAHHIGVPSLKMSAILTKDVTDTHSGSSLQVVTQLLAHVTTTLSASTVLPFGLDTFVDEVVGYYRALETQYGEYLNTHNVSLDLLKESIDDMSEVAGSLQQTSKSTDLQVAQMNRKLMKLNRIFIDENNDNFIRNMLLGMKSDYSTFPRLVELFDSPDPSIMQIREHLARLIMAFDSAAEVLAW